MKDFDGKVAVVTGGGGGIGKALGVRFGQAGMKVVLADNDGSLLEEPSTSSAVRTSTPIGVVTDVRLLESVEALRDATLDAYGAVHVVCNNAGIGAGSQKPFWEQNVNDWRWTYDVNVFGVVNGINAFVPVDARAGHRRPCGEHVVGQRRVLAAAVAARSTRRRRRRSSRSPSACGAACARSTPR